MLQPSSGTIPSRYCEPHDGIMDIPQDWSVTVIVRILTASAFFVRLQPRKRKTKDPSIFRMLEHNQHSDMTISTSLHPNDRAFTLSEAYQRSLCVVAIFFLSHRTTAPRSVLCRKLYLIPVFSSCLSSTLWCLFFCAFSSVLANTDTNTTFSHKPAGTLLNCLEMPLSNTNNNFI